MEGSADDAKPPPIVPQPPGESSGPVFQTTGNRIRKRPKASRQQVAVACLPCQKRKCRCDGTRPICSTCVTRGKTCEYNIDEGYSRVAHLKEKNKSLEENSKALEAIVELLRKGSDSDATAVLARLRVGDSIASIVRESSSIANSAATPLQTSTTQPTLSLQGSELDISGEIPNRLRANKIFDRERWSQPSQPTGASTFMHSNIATGSSQAPQASRSQTYAGSYHPSSTPTPAIVRRTAPLMIGHHETNPQELIKLRNFGNMDFSSGVLANNYPTDIQRQQVTNLFTPLWAKMTVPIILPEGHAMKEMSDVLIETYTNFRRLLDSGVSLLEIAGPHPRLAAIMNDEEFERAPPLSQWASRMVFSIKETNRLFVCYASMYLFWWIMRWMIHPSPETYFSIPEFLRPSPTQLFMPHLLPLEFFAWPGLRDYLVRVPEKFEQREWMYDMSLNIACACPLAKDEIMSPSPLDGELDLSPRALECASDVDNWSVKPSFRQYFIDADKYMRIRWED